MHGTVPRAREVWRGELLVWNELPRGRTVPGLLDAHYAVGAMPRVRERDPRRPRRRRRRRALHGRNRRRSGRTRPRGGMRLPARRRRTRARLSFPQCAGGEACVGVGADPVRNPLLEDPPPESGPEALAHRKSLKVGALWRMKPRSRRVNTLVRARERVGLRFSCGRRRRWGGDSRPMPQTRLGGPHDMVTSRTRAIRTSIRACPPRPRRARRARVSARTRP